MHISLFFNIGGQIFRKICKILKNVIKFRKMRNKCLKICTFIDLSEFLWNFSLDLPSGFHRQLHYKPLLVLTTILKIIFELRKVTAIGERRVRRVKVLQLFCWNPGISHSSISQRELKVKSKKGKEKSFYNAILERSHKIVNS